MPFDCNFTSETFQQMVPHNKSAENWFAYLEQILPDFEITSNLRVAAFISQCAHESGEFTVLQENLNYNLNGLLTVFPRYFPDQATAQQYAHNPQAIASRVYANRMGNGDESSGDGWLFHGRGAIQLTGRANYTQASADLYQDDSLVQNPDKLVSPDGAIYGACWFWHRNNLNAIADAADITLLTRRINGGTNGLADRLARYTHCLELL